MLAQLLTIDNSGNMKKPNMKGMRDAATSLGICNIRFSNSMQRLSAKKEGTKIIITISEQ